MAVTEVSDNVCQFGFADIPLGSPIVDHLDFMVGYDAKSPLNLPSVVSPGGCPIAINLLPDPKQDSIVVVIRDASDHYEQRLNLQQTANENELLVDKQKKLMVQLEEASRLQNLFLSGVSHEFRTPLSSIIGYANLLHRDVEAISEKIPEANSYLSAIRRSSDHLLSLIENLLDHGKLDSGELVINPKPICLLDLFDDILVILKPLAENKDIEFNFESNLAEQQNALIDASRLRQCLINIIGNAIKFTDKGSVSVIAKLQDNQLLVSVADTGLGMDAEDLSQSLLPFWQAPDTGKAGTGLGLTITQRIVELLGGSMSIESKLNEGTLVKFISPAPNCDLSSLSQSEIDLERSYDFRILLAEDDDDIADFVKVVLEEKGVVVKRVANGQLALDLLSKSKFDLILLDLHMPILSGYDVVRQLRDNDNKTPVVIMSATPLESEENKMQQLDCDGYLVKPVDVEDILRIAHELVE